MEDIHKSRLDLCVAVRPEIGLARNSRTLKPTSTYLCPPSRLFSTHSLAVAGGNKLKTGDKLGSREVNVVDKTILF